MSIVTLLITFLGSLFKSHRQLALENRALRQQVTMLRQSVKRPRATPVDKFFWIFFSRYVDGWRTTLHALHAESRNTCCSQRSRHHKPGGLFSTIMQTVWR
jgi:hypothetical protein